MNLKLSKALATAFLEGDERAIGEVYSKYRKFLYFIISNYLSSTSDIEDVYQEVFLSILSRKIEIKDPQKLHYYLCQMAKNEAINKAKSLQRRSGDEFDEETGDETKLENLAELLPYDLTNEERAVLGYRLCFGLSYNDISYLTGDPISTLKARYARAIKKTKEVLK